VRSALVLGVADGPIRPADHRTEVCDVVVAAPTRSCCMASGREWSEHLSWRLLAEALTAASGYE
jgi:hypothetical protein